MESNRFLKFLNELRNKKKQKKAIGVMIKSFIKLIGSKFVPGETASEAKGPTINSNWAIRLRVISRFIPESIFQKSSILAKWALSGSNRRPTD